MQVKNVRTNPNVLAAKSKRSVSGDRKTSAGAPKKTGGGEVQIVDGSSPANADKDEPEAKVKIITAVL